MFVFSVLRVVLSTGLRRECCVTVRSRWNACPVQWTATSSVDSSESATSPGWVQNPPFKISPPSVSAFDRKITCVVSQPQEGYLMVRQFQYLGWAGHREVPASKRSFLKLILQVDQWQREGEEGEGRTIVHCLWVLTPDIAKELFHFDPLGHFIRVQSMLVLFFTCSLAESGTYVIECWPQQDKKNIAGRSFFFSFRVISQFHEK